MLRCWGKLFCEMIQLAANYSNALVSLLKTDEAPIDGIEVGPWFTLPQIKAFQKRFPQWPFYFHGGSQIVRMGLLPGAARQIRAYHRCTQSPWASMHITMLRPGVFWLWRKFGWRLPPPNPAKATRRLLRQVEQLKRAIDTPLILENMPVLPFAGYEFQAEPDRIAYILKTTGCNLLLDLSHARIAASTLNTEVHTYLNSLPLDRVAQIHVSGARQQNGHLTDAHEALQEVDYHLLVWTLARTRPRILTLEYFRNADRLREQLHRLREIVNNNPK